MAGIDKLAEVMGRSNDLDGVERDNLCGDAADEIVSLRASKGNNEVIEALEDILSSLSVMDDEGLMEHAGPVMKARRVIARARSLA